MYVYSKGGYSSEIRGLILEEMPQWNAWKLVFFFLENKKTHICTTQFSFFISIRKYGKLFNFIMHQPLISEKWEGM